MLSAIFLRRCFRLAKWTALGLFCLTSLPATPASYSHGNIGSIYRYEYVPDFVFDPEISRLRDSLRAQQRHLREQTNRQEAQLMWLRKQVDATHRVSAEQACYYRMTGGLEACEDMFAQDSDNHALCEKKVKLRNPGCA